MTAGPDPVAPSLSPRLAEIEQALGEGDRAAFLEALGDRRVPAELLAAGLRRQGHEVGASTIRTYRRRVAYER